MSKLFRYGAMPSMTHPCAIVPAWLSTGPVNRRSVPLVISRKDTKRHPVRTGLYGIRALEKPCAAGTSIPRFEKPIHID
jgi:hypothetical protein